MKAAIVEKPGVLTVREIVEPQVGDYDALCKMLYGATCTGTDQHLIAGRFPWPVHYPTILGHESIGRVVAVGQRVRHFKVGDIVTRVGAPPVPANGLEVNWGGYAELGIAKDHWAMREDGLPESTWSGYRINQILPSGIDPAGATMVITWRETLSYLMRMGVGEGATLLVVGSGGNGLSFAAHAHNRGALRVAMLGSALRETTARTLGVNDYHDYRSSDAVDAINGQYPQGFDFIIDAVGQAGQLDLVLPLLKHGGVVGIYGIDDYGRCMLNPTRVRGTFTFYNGGYDEEETHAQVVADIQQGKLRAECWLDLAHPYALADIGKAFEDLHARKMVKAVVRLSTP
jgi:threonine dehydrogenase-like Zn-dependent dehydrogenase